MTKPRKDINELTPAEFADYTHALGILRSRSAANPDDETGYDFQAALHNDSQIGPCEHGNDLFMPWHRCHLHYFERLLQESDPPRTSEVTVPYWDWLHREGGARKFPDRFYEVGLYEADRDEESEDLPPNTLQIVLEVTDQRRFAGYPTGSPDGDFGDLESGPHNFMHPEYVGGKMAWSDSAALDPIYWSFHCFIDLLWDEWQRRNQDPELTSPAAALQGFTHLPVHRAGEFRRVRDLDYHYELTPRLQALFSAPPAQPVERSLLWAGTLTPLFPGGLSATLRERASADFAMPLEAAPGRRIQVRLDALKVPMTGSYLLFAYVHPRETTFDPDAPEFDRWSAGYVAMWRAHHGSHVHGGGHGHGHGRPHHPASATVRFDVTDILAGRSPSEMVLTLRYRPAKNQPGQTHPPDELVEEVQLSEVNLEVYD